MSKAAEPAARPRKRSEYEIRFASTHARKGWQDLLATTRNALTDAWDFLTRTPLAQNERNHTMRGELEFITRDGHSYQRLQHELPGGARIWSYVDEGVVWLTHVYTGHLNQTK